MGEITTIGWTDHTWNPWIGCAKVSPGCKHCYAEHETYARVSRGRGLELWGADAARHITTSTQNNPRTWADKARAAGVRRRVFCLSLGDFFEDRPELRAPRAAAYRTMVLTGASLDYLVLTKRPENAGRLLRQAHADGLPDTDGGPVWRDNIVLGATAEDQACLDERLPHLLAAGAKRTFLSCEPLLAPLDLTRALFRCGAANDGECSKAWCPQLRDGEPRRSGRHCPIDDWDAAEEGETPARVNWVIVGGESERKAGTARVFDLAWARSIVKQCKAADVPVFVKQMGANAIDSEAETWSEDGRFVVGTHTARVPLLHPKGEDITEWPVELRVQQMLRGLP